MIFANTEFYYTSPKNITRTSIKLVSDEARHAINVMRHTKGDLINITDGEGNIYKSKILDIKKDAVYLNLGSKFFQDIKLEEIIFYIPILKASDRLEFALEKCVELGITNFVIFSAIKSSKKNIKLERLNKIAIAAMKQSLRAYLPRISYQESIFNTGLNKNKWFVFDQLSDLSFSSILNNITELKSMNLLFGPEAGLSEEEIDFIKDKDIVYLTKSRLRSETAIITAASLLSSK